MLGVVILANGKCLACVAHSRKYFFNCEMLLLETIFIFTLQKLESTYRSPIETVR